MWKRILVIVFLLTLVLKGWFWYTRFQNDVTIPVIVEENPGVITVPVMEEKPVPPPVVIPKEVTETIQYTVPFTSQAPTGEWGKSAFQDGCEEASTLMVWMARTGTKLTREEAKTKLLDMAEFQEKKIGHGVDTDGVTTDTILLQEYFGITDSELIAYDFTLTELKLALKRGLVIVPTNGRALKNPNFTSPGPLQHMLVITGYDMATQEFITNDPGTRKGEGYRYPEQVLYAAIREYPTGKHLAIETSRKAMIVVPFESTR